MKENKTYTLAELKAMANKQFAYGTPLREVADDYANDYDFDSDTLNVKECCIDMFVYGAKWVLEQLSDCFNVYYVTPDIAEKEERNITTLTDEEFIKLSDYKYNSIKDFENGFNDSEISDLGYIRFIEEK